MARRFGQAFGYFPPVLQKIAEGQWRHDNLLDLAEGETELTPWTGNAAGSARCIPRGK